MIIRNHFILYVKDQASSTEFYTSVLGYPPVLNVPGMSEFELSRGCILGLMPSSGIKRLLKDRIPDPLDADKIPRAELYLLTDDAESYLLRALSAGAVLLSPVEERSWGDRAAYVFDPDNHIVAFAEKIIQ